MVTDGALPEVIAYLVSEVEELNDFLLHVFGFGRASVGHCFTIVHETFLAYGALPSL